MNFYSKYVSKYASGGVTSNENAAEAQQINESVATFFENYDNVFSQAVASNLGEEGLQVFDQLNALYKASAENEQAYTQLQQYLSDESVLNTIVQLVSAAQQQTSSYKVGGKIDYLNCLKRGGAVDCGCGKSNNVIKGENGLTSLKKIKQRFISKNGNGGPVSSEKYQVQFSIPSNVDSTNYVELPKDTWININGVPFKNQEMPGSNYTGIYGRVDPDGNIDWRQNSKDVLGAALFNTQGLAKKIGAMQKTGAYELIY